MANVVDRLIYWDASAIHGDGSITAEVLDNGSVRFTVGDPRLAHPASAALEADVLEQLAAKARAAKVAG
jgi:hypothetical protein